MAAGFELEAEGSAGGAALLLVKLESRGSCVVAEADRLAEFLLAFARAAGVLAFGFRLSSALLLAANGAAVRLLAFESRLNFALLLTASGAAIRLLAFEFRFDSARVLDRGVSRPAFAVVAELAPATMNTTSSLFECCST